MSSSGDFVLGDFTKEDFVLVEHLVQVEADTTEISESVIPILITWLELTEVESEQLEIEEDIVAILLRWVTKEETESVEIEESVLTVVQEQQAPPPAPPPLILGKSKKAKRRRSLKELGYIELGVDRIEQPELQLVAAQLTARYDILGYVPILEQPIQTNTAAAAIVSASLRSKYKVMSAARYKQLLKYREILLMMDKIDEIEP
jgi:hypothetical protein